MAGHRQHQNRRRGSVEPQTARLVNGLSTRTAADDWPTSREPQRLLLRTCASERGSRCAYVLMRVVDRRPGAPPGDGPVAVRDLALCAGNLACSTSELECLERAEIGHPKGGGAPPGGGGAPRNARPGPMRSRGGASGSWEGTWASGYSIPSPGRAQTAGSNQRSRAPRRNARRTTCTEMRRADGWRVALVHRGQEEGTSCVRCALLPRTQGFLNNTPALRRPLGQAGAVRRWSGGGAPPPRGRRWRRARSGA